MTHVLSLVVPCYNEEKTLRDIIDRILELQSDTLKLEIIVVDDCSSDNSFEVARQLEREIDAVKVFRHEKNQGKGAALRSGFLHATGDFVGIQDADMEYDPNEYPLVVNPIFEGKARVVYGSRFLNQKAKGYLLNRLANKGLTMLSKPMALMISA